MSTADLVGALIGLFLTLSIFSYLLGDNYLFRLVIHIFIGVASAFVVVIAWYNVIWPQLIQPLLYGALTERALTIILLILSLLLLTKAVPSLSNFGRPVMAILVGVGAATAISGAVVGTVIPQVIDSIRLFNLPGSTGSGIGSWSTLFNSGLLLVGTLTTLTYFHFITRTDSKHPGQKTAWLRWFAKAGKFFISITLGAVFAGVLLASLAALVDRLDFIVSLVEKLFNP